MCGEEAALRNHRGQGPKLSCTTPASEVDAASLREMAANPTGSWVALNAARARRLRRMVEHGPEPRLRVQQVSHLGLRS